MTLTKNMPNPVDYQVFDQPDFCFASKSDFAPFKSLGHSAIHINSRSFFMVHFIL